MTSNKCEVQFIYRRFPHFIDDMLLNVTVSVIDELERMRKEAILEYCTVKAPSFRHTVMILISLKWVYLIDFINMKSVSISGIWTSKAFIKFKFFSMGGPVTGVNLSLIILVLVVRVSGYRSRGPGFDSRPYQIF
jgi:hypothetical protein